MKRFREGLEFKAHRLLCHSTLGSKVMKKKKDESLVCVLDVDVCRLDVTTWCAGREFFIDNLLVHIHLITKMMLVDRPRAMRV